MGYLEAASECLSPTPGNSRTSMSLCQSPKLVESVFIAKRHVGDAMVGKRREHHHNESLCVANIVLTRTTGEK